MHTQTSSYRTSGHTSAGSRARTTWSTAGWCDSASRRKSSPSRSTSATCRKTSLAMLSPIFFLMTTTSKKPDRFTHKINLFDFLKTIQIFGIHTYSRQKNIVFGEIKTWTELKLTFRLFLSTTFRRVRRFISSTSRL